MLFGFIKGDAMSLDQSSHGQTVSSRSLTSEHRQQNSCFSRTPKARQFLNLKLYLDYTDNEYSQDVAILPGVESLLLVDGGRVVRGEDAERVQVPNY